MTYGQPEKVDSCDKTFPLSPAGWQWSAPAFLLQDPEQHRSHQIPREHFSQLCKHSLFWCAGFLMMRCISVIKGSLEEDSKGESINTHKHTHTLSCLPAHTAFEKESIIKSFFFLFFFFPFYSAAVRWHHCFPHVPLCILISARERMNLLRNSMKKFFRYWAGRLYPIHALSFIQVYF